MAEQNGMTLQEVIDVLLDEARADTPRAVAITRAVLLAYEMGLAQGRQEAHQRREED